MSNDPNSVYVIDIRADLAAYFPQHAHAVPGKDHKLKCVRKAPPDPLPSVRLGLYPIEPGSSTTQVGVLDFDDHQEELTWEQMVAAAVPVVAHLRRLGHNPMPFRSTGGRGIHVWLVWSEPQQAVAVQTLLEDALVTCGLENGAKGVAAGQVEIFPKQGEVPVGSVGNCITLPMTGESVPLHPEGLDVLARPRMLITSAPLKPVWEEPAEEVSNEFEVERVKSALAVIPADDYGIWIDVLRALKGGAKCAGIPDGEAKALAWEWSAGGARPKEWEFENKWAKAFPKEARGQGRSLGTLFWLAKKNGWEPPERPCAVERIRIQESDPPLFLVTVTGSNVEAELQATDFTSPMKFQSKVLEKTYKLITKPTIKDLQRLLAEAERIPVDETVTTLGQFKALLWEFLDQHVDPDVDKLRLEHAWFDEKKQRMWFRWPDFEGWLKRNRSFAFVGKHADAFSAVRKLGGDTDVVKSQKSALRCWWVPGAPTKEEPLHVPDVTGEGDEVPFA